MFISHYICSNGAFFLMNISKIIWFVLFLEYIIHAEDFSQHTGWIKSKNLFLYEVLDGKWGADQVDERGEETLSWNSELALF